jgi:hypothetical protein
MLEACSVKIDGIVKVTRARDIECSHQRVLRERTSEGASRELWNSLMRVPGRNSRKRDKPQSRPLLSPVALKRRIARLFGADPRSSRSGSIGEPRWFSGERAHLLPGT